MTVLSKSVHSVSIIIPTHLIIITNSFSFFFNYFDVHLELMHLSSGNVTFLNNSEAINSDMKVINLCPYSQHAYSLHTIILHVLAMCIIVSKACNYRRL